ncbi:MAG: alkaline phosphatase family protein [Legionella sp.]|nr:alkaline phosphatase family protein [Legionella sp.]
MRKIALLLLLSSSVLFAENPPPKLILQLVVDQLRGDLIQQYHSAFGADGFNYLLNHSINFQNAHHPHANTVTCVGHATIATGSYPYLHGIIANDWFNRDTQKETYCVEDLQSKILPTTRTKIELPGRSPRNVLSSTLSDEIILAKKGRAFGVALKDRAAITLAGHAGKAFWFDKENGGFITSTHYYQSYPAWVNQWDSQYQPKNETWALSQSNSAYRFASAPRFKNRFPEFGETFPHHTGEPGNPLYYKYLSMTPNADELTANFAERLLSEEKLGQSPNQTDYLAISFSTVDTVGHQFGPNSQESEDALRRLDKTLAKLLKAIDEKTGLQNTLIILTADHGVTDAPAYLHSQGIHETALPDTAFLRQVIESTLQKNFNLPPATLQSITLPYIYLDHQLLAKQSYTTAQISQKLADNLNQHPGVFKAYSLPVADIEKNWLSSKVDKMAFPNRSGDVYIVPAPYQSPMDESVRVDHGTPWNYDSFVPLLFVNPAFKARRILTPASTTDIAATVAAILEIKAPSASVGQPLQAVVDFYENNDK